MNIRLFAYVYRYVDVELHGGGLSLHEYLSLSANPGIYYAFNGKWSVLDVTNFGSYNTLNHLEVPNEVKIHHLLTN